MYYQDDILSQTQTRESTYMRYSSFVGQFEQNEQ